MSADGGAAKPLDLEHLHRYTLGDEDLERQLFGMFFPDAEAHLASMASAATDDAWHRSAHGLKGAARGLGAWDVANLAETAESLTAAGERAAHIERMRAALARLHAVVVDLLGEVEPPPAD